LSSKRKLFFYIYDVIVKQKKRKRSAFSLITARGVGYGPQ
jgi:hypothetical protein